MNKNHIFHFYFLNKDFWLNIEVNVLKSFTYVKNILIEGSVFQIFYLGLKHIFHQKTGWRRVKFASPNA